MRGSKRVVNSNKSGIDVLFKCAMLICGKHTVDITTGYPERSNALHLHSD